jgi:hypothetical protein
MVKLAIFDDTDPSITYNGSWDLQGVLSTYSPEYNSTVHHTTDSSATIDISFQGMLSLQTINVLFALGPSQG